MRPIVNASVAPQPVAVRPAGFTAVLGVLLAIGVTMALVFGVVPGAERSSTPSGLEVTSASAIVIE